MRVSTQWRVGFGGPTGLDYPAVLAVIDRMRLPPEEADSLFADVCVIESGALAQMQANREAAEAARKTP